MTTFECVDCKQVKPVHINGSTAYAVLPDTTRVCYTCCGERDKRDMEAGKPTVLYVTVNATDSGRGPNAVVSNWPGTLKIPCGAKVSKRGGGFGCQRTDVWFSYAGFNWHGVNRGDNDVVRCRTIKKPL